MVTGMGFEFRILKCAGRYEGLGGCVDAQTRGQGQVPGYEVSITTRRRSGPLSRGLYQALKVVVWVGLSWFDGGSDELFTRGDVTCSTFGLTFRVAASNLTVAPHM